MNSETLLQLVQNGFRITLGATASLIETLQNPEKRTENLEKLQQEWSKLSEEWVAKGEVTEQEARDFVSNFLNQRKQQPSQEPSSSTVAPENRNPSSSPSIQAELQELTVQIALIRAELEKLRDSQ